MLILKISKFYSDLRKWNEEIYKEFVSIFSGKELERKQISCQIDCRQKIRIEGGEKFIKTVF